MTIPELFRESVSRFGAYPALASKNSEEWEVLNFNQYYEACRKAARALIKVNESFIHPFMCRLFNHSFRVGNTYTHIRYKMYKPPQNTKVNWGKFSLPSLTPPFQKQPPLPVFCMSFGKTDDVYIILYLQFFTHMVAYYTHSSASCFFPPWHRLSMY